MMSHQKIRLQKENNRYHKQLIAINKNEYIANEKKTASKQRMSTRAAIKSNPN